jgi:class 3 adenylate cyclase
VLFTEDRLDGGDQRLQRSIAAAGIPVVLAVGQCDGCTRYAPGEVQLTGIDQLPVRTFRCLDTNVADPLAPCSAPIANVQLGSTLIVQGDDGVIRQLPMFVEPACRASKTCALPVLHPISFVAYRDFLLGSGTGGADLQLARPGAAEFGSAWSKPLWVDGNGMAPVYWSAAPGAVQQQGRYVSFADAYSGRLSRAAVDGKIVVIGSYNLTGFHDAQLVPTSGGAQMSGVEIHANALSELLAPQQSRFTYPEPGWAVLLTLLLLCTGMGLLLARVSVLLGAAATLAALVLYTAPWLVLANVPIPDLIHPWLGIGLTYTAVTSYRFLYEDREKRKVTAIFGQYLKPQIVSRLAAKRSLEDIELGGERRQLTLLFVDIRGFTSMSESMDAHDVVKVLDEYLAALTEVVFRWDGTLDKYVGDEIMAAWNAVEEQPRHALQAVRCAFEMLQRGPALNSELAAKGLPEVRYGIGVNTGPAVWGNMGSPARRQFTAIGDTVNTAARFCGVAGAFELLIGESTYQSVKDLVEAELVTGVQLKGKSADRFRVYKVTAVRDEHGSAPAPVLAKPERQGAERPA